PARRGRRVRYGFRVDFATISRSAPGYARRMRKAIRIGIPAAGAAAIVIGIALPTSHDLPALALGNRELLWLERTLLLFYGVLLLFVPVVRALQGELPIELSARGAHYAEASDDAEI